MINFSSQIELDQFRPGFQPSDSIRLRSQTRPFNNHILQVRCCILLWKASNVNDLTVKRLLICMLPSYWYSNLDSMSAAYTSAQHGLIGHENSYENLQQGRHFFPFISADWTVYSKFVLLFTEFQLMPTYSQAKTNLTNQSGESHTVSVRSRTKCAEEE